MRVNMVQSLIKKLDSIESLLVIINGKIDNFLGFEEISGKEKEELEKLRKKINSGEYSSFNDVFM